MECRGLRPGIAANKASKHNLARQSPFKSADATVRFVLVLLAPLPLLQRTPVRRQKLVSRKQGGRNTQQRTGKTNLPPLPAFVLKRQLPAAWV